MNDRQRLEAIVAVVCKYLPPDGISREQAMNEIIGLIDPLPPQLEQEPVAWMDVDGKTFPFVWNVSLLGVQQSSKYLDETLTPLYTHPPQRTWVGLTGEEAMDVTRKEGHELLDFIYEYGTGSEGVEERIVAICKAIEAKLKEKNT